jgi:urease accessory protein
MALTGSAALLLLADGRFPAGGHAHSGGIEEAVASGRVGDLASLHAFLAGRLWTVGLVAAAFSATGARFALETARSADQNGRGGEGWVALDAEAEARMASPALRRASRRLGRQLLRVARGVWPGPLLDGLAAAVPAGPHHPVALGAAAAAAGLPAGDAALAAAQESVAGPATAALRLLGLDPVAVAAVLARLAPQVEAVAAEAAACASARRPWSELPAVAAPLLELGAELHAAQEVRLFAS